MAKIDVEGFVKDYGSVRVLHEVNLHIGDGEFVVLLGPSGCGKSTMLRMIAGLEEISGGVLRIDGVPMNDMPAGNRDIAMVFQNYALYPHMTVYDNMAFGLRRLRVPKAELDRRVRHVAGLLSLGDHLQRKPRQLSGGQQQRVAMGRAMIKTPKVFLFDEPLSNLDAALRDQLRIEVKKLHMLLKTTTVFVTHDQLEAMTLADKIVVMRGGHIEQIGTPREVYYAPASLFVASFIGTPTMNLLPMRVTSTAPLRLAAEGIDLTLDPTRFGPLSQGQEVTLGIRPKDLLIGRPDDAPAPLTGTVELTEMMGAESLMQIRIGPHELIMLVPDRDVVPTGSKIELTPAPDAVLLFDGKTERSLAAAPRARAA